uniref:PPM-type phosphatase domain-containing protein n=1 Tax=Gasterosteus aculeatus aculeatus TaxID=481459 RepID=A0AAQ4QWL4_GASAC
MCSPALLHLLRCARTSVTRRASLSCTASRQGGGASRGVRRASGSTRFDSFGIWDNRREEAALRPPGAPRRETAPQVGLSRVGSASVLGLRRQNEDRLSVARIHDDLLYFAVFDGHGGPHAADYCATFMEKFIRGSAASWRGTARARPASTGGSP